MKPLVNHQTAVLKKNYSTPEFVSHGGVEKITQSIKHAGGSAFPAFRHGDSDSGHRDGTHGWNYYTR